MKFINLLKKELSELINKNMIVSLVVVCVLFMIIGQVMQQSFDDLAKSEYTMNVLNLDSSDFIQTVFDELENQGAEINLIYADNTDDYSSLMAENDIESLIIIPENFTSELIENKNISTIKSVSIMKSASALSSLSSDTSSATSNIKAVVINQLMISGGFSQEDIDLIQSPFDVQEVTVVGEKSANISIDTIISNVSMLNMILPIIVFVLVMYTSQMIISAISTEKIDKTLETLLSTPVSRTSVIGAKMLSACIVALINAVAFMLSYYIFIGGALSSTVTSSETVGNIISESISYQKAMNQLGLNLGIIDYALICVQLFLTIMISLSVSIILGVMADDSKSAQTLIMPVMVCAMVPYMVSMVSDINQLSPVIRTIIYAIPFTHTFTAMTNLMFGNTGIFIFGIIYQIVFFAVCMFFALKIFNSDKIFTVSLNLGQKSRLKKSKSK